jgi:hypothetical protein
MLFYVVCLWETILYVCGMCHALVFQHYHDISAPLPLLVSNLNIHDIIVVHTYYILECTSLYYNTCPVTVQVCTEYTQVQ